MEAEGGWVKSMGAWLPWVQKGFWAVLDQGLFSGANFLVNILLARWLEPEEYGAFAVALSIYYLVLNFHTAVLTEPMMVFGAGKYREQFRKYLGILLYGHFALSAVISFTLGLAALVTARYGSPALAQAMVGLAIASPFLLLLWLTRRGCYVHLRPTWAVMGSGINFVFMSIGLFLFKQVRCLTPFSGLVLLGIAAGGASSLLALNLRPQLLLNFMSNPKPTMIAQDHWNYGTWNLLGVLAYWASGQILMLLIPIFLGLTASAAMAAVWNLYRPLNLFTQSMNLLLLPVFSKRIEHDGLSYQKFQHLVIRFAVLLGGGAVLYSLILTAIGQPILDTLYMGKYNNHRVLVELFGIVMVASAITGTFITSLKARRNIRKVFNIWGLSCVVTILVGIPLLLILDLEGALIAFTISYTVAGILAFREIYQ